MNQYFITETDFNKFIESLRRHYTVYIPYLKEDKHEIGISGKDTDPSFNPYRVSTPIIKSVLFAIREAVVPLPESPHKKNIVFGLKTCDLASLPVMDYVFKEGDFQDPLYIANRENTVIISSDCTDCLETCFCTLTGNNPYPEKDFDINISPVENGSILAVATGEGEKIIDKTLLQDPTADQLKTIEKNRETVKNKVESQVAGQGYNIITSLQNAVMDNFDSPVWADTTQACVECGGCNFVCPTCHCFILSDHDKERYRQWDACQYRTFALVAGGANPRKKLYQRVRNRYVKKFDFFQKNISLYGCTGCGRCIHACIGKIDIREVLKKLVTGDIKNEKPV